ncbi:MAG TPA: hypothetical protein EYP19_09105 [Desulfobacterales bacterium]|nr:hypothetical protein [Desulfobacterales bacterium]
MTTYNVLLKCVVNVRIVNVEAANMEAALERCRGEVDFSRLLENNFHVYSEQWPDLPPMTVAYTGPSDEFNESLVDAVGDDEHKNSRWIT